MSVTLAVMSVCVQTFSLRSRTLSQARDACVDRVSEFDRHVCQSECSKNSLSLQGLRVCLCVRACVCVCVCVCVCGWFVCVCVFTFYMFGSCFRTLAVILVSDFFPLAEPIQA